MKDERTAAAQKSGDRLHAKGKIDVHTYRPEAYDKVDEGPEIVEINVTEAFKGDIEGEGRVRFLQTLRHDGSASFVGVERVTGRLAGRSGSFVLQDHGTADGKTVRGQWFVVPGSGTDELVGLRGEGGFVANIGEGADITLDYWFE
jgi:uncharacterized protein DUF3224